MESCFLWNKGTLIPCWMVDFRKELRDWRARRDTTTQTARPTYRVTRSPIFATLIFSRLDSEDFCSTHKLNKPKRFFAQAIFWKNSYQSTVTELLVVF